MGAPSLLTLGTCPAINVAQAMRAIGVLFLTFPKEPKGRPNALPFGPI